MGILNCNVKGFSDLIKNTINIRNLISHNMAIYEEDIKYQSSDLNEFYFDLLGEHVHDGVFRLPHIIKCIGKLSGNNNLYQRTIDSINRLKITDQHKLKILKLFAL
jgi:abortive infection bacteriophage resistance protein